MINWRRKRIWIGLPLLALLAVAAAIGLSSGRGMNRAMAEWRAQGLPATSEELHDWYRAVPVERNAALKVLKAADLHVLAAGAKDPNGIRFGSPGAALSDEERQIVADYLAANQETLAALYEALELPESRYPVQLWQGFNLLRIDHIAPIKGLGQLLRWEAIDHAINGRRAEAVKSLIAGFALARTLSEEPILISELVRIAVVAINLSALEQLLGMHQLTPEEIQTLQEELARTEKEGRRAMFRALVGERAGGSVIFRGNFHDFARLSGPGTAPSTAQQLFGGTMFALFKVSGLQARDARVYLETMQDYISASTNEFPEAMRMARQAEQNFDERIGKGLGRTAIMSRMLLPALLKALTKEGVIAARLRCTSAALQVELMRLKSGAPPENSSGFDLPEDPFNGQPLVYERLTNGYAIHSPGATEIAGTKTVPRVGIIVAR